jgi:hypothetical protein
LAHGKSLLAYRERVVEGLECFSPGRRVENEASSVAPVLNLDAEFIFELAVIPEQVDDDPVGLAVSEVCTCG